MKATVIAAVVVSGILALEGRSLAIGGIHVYRRNVSGLAARVGMRCRFTPTCSHYAEMAIARDGLLRGGWKAVRRIARCGPWTRTGTVDPP